ncbi:transposase family protein [Vitreoscilla massiliensis]|uniref:Transposase family protein n=1 Tax=Vitreoscilla massiliensis TaxID=1689272 RepID=A0ABY4E455_9NEIS|nr:Mu transposase C-terminal domain-containing protein [Vitreoscilla massiliensis]UOO89625.1 transposase family protein [Vitreoscilla massiliensis]
MNSKFSSAELAEMNLLNMPKSKQAIEYIAKRDGWQYEYVLGLGRGGKKKVFLLNGLPMELQDAIKQKQLDDLMQKSQPVSLPSVVKKKKLPAKTKKLPVGKKSQQLALAIDEANGLNDKQRDIAHARMAIVAEVNKMHQVGGLPLKEAAFYVTEQIKTGVAPESLMYMVEVANARGNKKRTVSFSSLYQWTLKFREAKTPNERLLALAPKLSSVEKPLIEYEWLPEFMPIWADANNPPLTHVYKSFEKVWAQKGFDMAQLPSFHTVERVVQKMPLIMRERGRKTGGAYKAILPYVKRDWLIFEPNDIWVGDGHGFKAKVAHPIHGQPFQPEITAIIDTATRFVVGWTVSLSESTVAHADALRVAMSFNDPPLMYYTDNGSGPTGKMVDADITGILPRLGIEHPTGLPGNPQGRGIIERLWETVTIPLARTYATYVGNDADNSTKTMTLRKVNSAMNAENKKKELNTEQRRNRAKLPKFEQFMVDLAKAFDDYNNRHEHSELMKASNKQYGTPSAYRAARLKELGKTVVPLSQDELDMMFRPEEIRTANRGQVELFNNIYFSQALAEFSGGKVRVGYDLHNPEMVLIKRMDGQFICKALWDGNKVAAFPVSVIDQQRKKRVEGITKRKQDAIAIAQAELYPTIEHQPDFGLLLANGANEVETVSVQKPPLFMFESDREAWEIEQRNKSK